MLRRIAITLATVVAAGFVAAVPAAADGWEGGQVGGGYAQFEGDHAGAEYLNLGGPYGHDDQGNSVTQSITRAFGLK
ncbi:hypothetical protein ABZV34_31105 [Streptomyces sp. NPDC005195]|uniref:hypothetical protein n=1 Tax=Streptomyces sp. NPDC005195 TaxID=3154561 RepID=UPI0033BAF4C1